MLIWNDALRDGPLGEPNVVLGQGALNRCTANDDDADGDTDPATRRTLSFPAGVWSDDNLLIVADRNNNRVLIWDDLDTITSFAEAAHVIGQQNFSDIAPNGGADAPSATTLFGPQSVDVSAAGELAVTDTKNHRVLIWRTVPFTIGTPADHVVGQSDFESGAEHPASAKTLRFPEGARFQGRDLVVNDSGNNRVMVWRESD